ncbi:hypothetical protein BVG79_01612 [Ketogulonicigenium robustum]|uniref:Uncharacterized protein n=2 Tax=Ketogulonicigenium robustum TaxID=92947 RepID=A0A1W6P0B4_9RHOB|nr:hypothetical protein BVG79_01612 [Ketogulonicigenium robustum]
MIIGAAIGAWRAKQRGGAVLDMVQWGAVHAVVGMLIATAIFVIILRRLSA